MILCYVIIRLPLLSENTMVASEHFLRKCEFLTFFLATFMQLRN